MKSSKKRVLNYGFWGAIGFLTLIAFVLRIKCCSWGYPLQIHSDEKAVVEWAVEMLGRHSWEAHFYDRPDHFEIKFDAVIFTIVSWIKYHKPAYEAFEEHKMAFYMLARAFTVMFGTALIPLTALYAGRLTKHFESSYRRVIQFMAAAFVAFSSIYVQHSAYATPDIILTFFIVLFAYGSLCYMEEGNKYFFYLSIVIIGAGITLKYPAAILCVPLALMVIIRAGFVERKPLDIVKYGFISIGLILLTILMLAPNLITDFNAVYTNFVEEARPNHLGQDGLGFFGNLVFYLRSVWQEIGVITVIPFAAGIAHIIRHRNIRWLSLFVGLIYWLCMSVLSLHWLRWGIPMYVFYMIVLSVGLVSLLRFFREKYLQKRSLSLGGCGIVCGLMVVLVLNVVLEGVSIVKFSGIPDTRVTAGEFLAEKGITEPMCLYEGYTPFAPAVAKRRLNDFTLSKDGNMVTVNDDNYTYFIMSDSFKKRYLADTERYSHEAGIYNGIENTYDIVYRIIPDGNYSTNMSVVKNIIQSFGYIVTEKTSTGDTITVYNLKAIK